MEKTINVNGKDIRIRASALIPRLYRAKIGRDIIVDMTKLQKELVESKENALTTEALTIYENIAYIMCYNADNTIGETPDEWLDSIDGVFDIYTYLPDILDLWAKSNKQTSIPKK